jgi:aarF domain-containing kinase
MGLMLTIVIISVGIGKSLMPRSKPIRYLVTHGRSSSQAETSRFQISSSSKTTFFDQFQNLFTDTSTQKEMTSLLKDIKDIIQTTGLRSGIHRAQQGARAITDLSLEYIRNPIAFQNGSSLNAPVVLRKLFEKLGATYIKLGQFIASSPTLFPAEYVKEFQKCLDKTPTYPYSVIRKIIQSELGHPLSSVYSYIDPQPLASASIAQVHRARLRSTKQEVVIKVRKPDVESVLKADLGFLYIISRILEIINPSLQRLSLSAIVGDIRASMLEELNFNLEAQNLVNFRDFLIAKGLDKSATAPEPILEYTSRKVLTMEYLDGVPLVDLESIRTFVPDPEVTLMNALGTWATSVAEHESFHADVHAGNLLVLRDGRVGFIDFGIVGRISDKVWNALSGLIQGAATQNFRLVAQSLADIGATNDIIDLDAFGKDLEEVFAKIYDIEPTVSIQTMQGQSGAMYAQAQLAVDDSEITELVLSLVNVSEKNGLKLPREFGLLMKQALYFDRYQKVLAPNTDPLRDPRLIESLKEVELGLESGKRVRLTSEVIDVEAKDI